MPSLPTPTAGLVSLDGTGAGCAVPSAGTGGGRRGRRRLRCRVVVVFVTTAGLVISAEGLPQLLLRLQLSADGQRQSGVLQAQVWLAPERGLVG